MGGVHNGGVIIENGQFHYLYRGHIAIEEDPGYLCKIGLARSDDGYEFEKFGGNPVIGEKDGYSYEDVNLTKFNDTYYLFCNRWDWSRRKDPTASGTWLATSKDLIHWKEHGLVFPETDTIASYGHTSTSDSPGSEGKYITVGKTETVHRNGVVLQTPENEPVKVNGKFIMYLNDGLIAYSSNLIDWKSKRVRDRWPGGECCMAIADYLSEESDNIVLFTGGGGIGTPWEGTHRYAIGEVLLSKTDPKSPIDVLDRPVIHAEEKYPWEDGKSASEPYKTVSSHRDTVFFNGLTRYNDKWWMYYGGSEVYTCLATAPARG